MKLSRLSVLGASALIAACGGGSGHLGGGLPSTSTFDITSANAATATRVSWEAMITSGNFGSLGGGIALTASAPDGSAKPSPAAAAVSKVINVIQMDPFGPLVLPCQSDGIITLSGDVTDLETLTVGDTYQMTYESCDDGFGEVIDGIVDLEVREISGDLQTDMFMLSMDAVMTDLQVATGTDTIVNNGDATISLDTMQSPYVAAGTSGTSVTVDSNAGSETLRNYATNQSIDGGREELPFTLSASGSLDSTELDGIVQYSTPVTFSGEGFAYPSAGSLLVEGENSSARLTAVDDVNVVIEVDANGDGVIDDTINTTWASLTSS